MLDVRRLVTDYFHACNAHDTAAVAALYAPGGSHEDIATRHRRDGRMAIAEGLGHFLKALPDVRWTEKERIVAGHSVVVTYVLTGHLQGPLGPFAPAGQSISLNGAFIFAASDAGIESTRDYWNAGEFAHQASQPSPKG